MTDSLTPSQRSWNMSRIRSQNTKPERVVGSLLHRMGFRYRLYRRDLPGTPDIVFTKHKSVIFVHGCFWHRHEGCKGATTPTTNIEYWTTKFAKNIERDNKNQQQLKQMGWRVILVWQCELNDLDKLALRLYTSLTDPNYQNHMTPNRQSHLR